MTSRDIKLENTLLDGSPRPLIKVRQDEESRAGRATAAVSCMPLWAVAAPAGSMRPRPRPSSLQLADFGFSKDANQHSAPTSRVGTPAYLAPEVVTNEPGEHAARCPAAPQR